MVRRERVFDPQLPRGQLGMCGGGGKGGPTHPTRTPMHVRIRSASPWSRGWGASARPSRTGEVTAPQRSGGAGRGAEQQVLQPGRGDEKGLEMAGLGQAPCGGTSGRRVPSHQREAGRGVEKGEDRGTAGATWRWSPPSPPAPACSRRRACSPWTWVGGRSTGC